MSDIKFLTETLCIVMRHDPITAAKTAAVYERRSEPRKKLSLVNTRRKR